MVHDAHDHDATADDLPGPAPHRRLSRRRVLASGSALALPGLAGCMGGDGGDGAVPGAVSLAGDLTCDQCGMVISQHRGPNGQLFYADNSPAGHDNPARFDALKQCFFPYRFEHEQLGWSVEVAYVTDYSAVDYDLVTEGEKTYISVHTAPESFARAPELSYVVDSDVYGAMGADFVPFSKRGDADAFAAERGGEVVSYDDIGPELVSQ